MSNNVHGHPASCLPGAALRHLTSAGIAFVGLIVAALGTDDEN